MTEGWRYYNHALIPTCAPHESPNTESMDSEEFWKTDKGLVLFARWTDEFDNNEFSEFWYCIRKAPFVVDQLPQRAKKHIRQALKKCYVRKVDALDHIDELYEVFTEACKNYKLFDGNTEYNEFKKRCINDTNSGRDYWAGYSIEGKLIGYMIAEEKTDYAEIVSAKFHPGFLKMQVSDALYVTVLDHYLNNLKKSYISSGTRSLNHITNTQEYKEKNFGYVKAYCKLHIVYNPKIRVLVRVLYPFRRILSLFDNISGIHKINSVLKMEEIVRKQKKEKR